MVSGRRFLRGLWRGLTAVLLTLVGVWTLGALRYTGGPWGGLRVALALAFAGTVLVLLVVPSTRRYVPWVVVGVFLLALVRFWTLSPSNDRDWIDSEARTASAVIEGDRLVVHDVRNARYDAEGTPEVRWEVRTYDLAALERVWFLVVPFQDFALGAHTFVSFEFAGGEYLAISIEARKTKDEAYDMVAGLYRSYEVIYVVADERDVIGLRTHTRGDTVHLYPMRSTPEGRRTFLLDMLRRVNELHETPDFYNTLANTCTTGLHEHLNRAFANPEPLTIEILLSALSDRRAYELGLIDTDLSLEEAKARFRVDASMTSPDAPDFSSAIRSAGATPR